MGGASDRITLNGHGLASPKNARWRDDTRTTLASDWLMNPSEIQRRGIWAVIGA